MNGSFNRKQIAEGVYFNRITDKRFKLGRVSVVFLTDLKKDTASVNALIPRLISATNANYPDEKLLRAKEASLYAARIDYQTFSIGDTQCLSVDMLSIDDKYALEDENVTEEATDLLIDCIFNPKLENSLFHKDEVEQNKRLLIESIEAELNEKRIYAMKRAMELLCEGEPAENSASGSVENVRAADEKSLFDAYTKLLKNTRVEIIAAGPSDFAGAEKKLTEAFVKIGRTSINESKSVLSRAKAETLIKTETLPVNQSKMVLGFKTTSDNIKATKMMTAIYGGTTTSKLFLNVREKLSLCYYCSASYNQAKGIILVNCGVEAENIEKAKAEIIKQFDDIKNGVFDAKDIEYAKLSLENDTKAYNDSLSLITMWYLKKIYENDIRSPEEAVNDYEDVTKEDIIAAANSVKLDTVYILTGEE